MTTLDAERLIREFWAHPPRTPLAYSARLCCMLRTVQVNLPDAAMWHLCERLGYEPPARYKRAQRRGAGNPAAAMDVLYGIVDRSADLGLRIPAPGPEEQYRLRGRDIAGRN